MPPHATTLGVMRPLGGGDPVPLNKAELYVGRRPSCDICLDFANVSGKHCVLRMINQVWHVRDLGSTNGTTINGSLISSEHSVMPDDELGVAGHLYSIDYEPGAPETILQKHSLIDDNLMEARKKTRLVELAGLDTDEDKPDNRHRRPSQAPAAIARPTVDEADFDDVLPEHVKAAPPPRPVETTDDDFLKFIEEDAKKAQP
jgi:hypothetical protein